MTDVWNPSTAYLASGGSIRNSNVQLNSGTTINGQAQAITNIGRNVATASYYFEVTIHDTDPDNQIATGVGIDINPQANNPENLMLWSDGNVYNESAIVHTIPNWPTSGLNGVVGVAVKNNQIWFRVNGGKWNGNASANPVTNVGGFSLTATPLYWPSAAVNFNASSTGPATADINTGPMFAYAIPAGFTSWYSGGISPVVPIDPGVANVSAQSPNPPVPNHISPGGTGGIRWSYPDKPQHVTV